MIYVIKVNIENFHKSLHLFEKIRENTHTMIAYGHNEKNDALINLSEEFISDVYDIHEIMINNIIDNFKINFTNDEIITNIEKLKVFYLLSDKHDYAKICDTFINRII